MLLFYTDYKLITQGVKGFSQESLRSNLPNVKGNSPVPASFGHWLVCQCLIEGGYLLTGRTAVSDHSTSRAR